MKRIYSDLAGYVMTSETGNPEVYLVDQNGSHYRPNLIIPNLLALHRLKRFCEKVLEEQGFDVSKYPGEPP